MGLDHIERGAGAEADRTRAGLDIAQAHQTAAGTRLIVDLDVARGGLHQAQFGQIGMQSGDALSCFQPGRTADQRLRAAADHAQMHARPGADNGPSAAAQVQVQGQIFQGWTAGIADAAAAGLHLRDDQSARSLDGDGAVLRPQTIQSDVAGAAKAKVQVAGVGSVEIGEGARIAALAQATGAIQTDLADVGGGQAAGENHLKAVTAQGSDIDVATAQRWRAVGLGDGIDERGLDGCSQRAARGVPGDRRGDIAARAPGQGQGEAAPVGIAQIDNLGFIKAAGSDAGVDPGDFQLFQVDRGRALQGQAAGAQGLARVGGGGVLRHLSHGTGLERQAGSAEQAHLQGIALVGDQTQVAARRARPGYSLRDVHITGAQHGNGAIGRLQVADGHIAKGQQVDPPGQAADRAQAAGLHQEGALMLCIAADVIPGRQHH